ncbi:MAG: transglycosylase SLT domain-containing protein [Gemmatimonadota bacterium]
MKDLRDTYVHRGDGERLGQRVRGVLMVAGIGVAGLLAARNWAPPTAEASPSGGVAGPFAHRVEVAQLRHQIEEASGQLKVATAHLDRWSRIFAYAREYGITADLAAAIHDVAVEEKIDPELAFPLIRLESRFDERATSSAGAIGLAQVMLGTARGFDKTMTAERLYDRETNLRIGFRYLRQLIRWQRGDVQMALLAYNRGPAAVETARELALDPSNGYESVILRGYRGRGIVD